MTSWFGQLRTIPRRAMHSLRARRRVGTGASEAARTPAKLLSPEEERAAQARRVFSNGALPTNFSITLGAAPCNHSCLFCPQSVHKPRKAAWLDMGLLRKVANEMPEQGMMINVSSYSETLAAPNLVEAIRILKEVRPRLRLCMATNGSLFKENVIREVMQAGLDHYSYSFDAPDRESYRRLMQVDHFDRVWNNLERIVAIQKELGAATVITTHIMGFEEFREKFAEFEKYWAPKVNVVYLREVKNWGGATWGLEAQLAKGGFTIPPSAIPVKRYPCSSIFTNFELHPTGHYAPCVASVPDYLPEEELHDVPYLGHARDMTFLEAWERLGAMRRAHLAGEWSEYSCCSTCNIWSAWPNVWVDRGAAAGRARFDIPDTEYVSKPRDDSEG